MYILAIFHFVRLLIYSACTLQYLFTLSGIENKIMRDGILEKTHRASTQPKWTFFFAADISRIREKKIENKKVATDGRGKKMKEKKRRKIDGIIYTKWNPFFLLTLLFYSTHCQLLLLLLLLPCFFVVVVGFVTYRRLLLHSAYTRQQDSSIKKIPLQFTVLCFVNKLSTLRHSILFTLFWLRQSLSNGVGI